MLIFLPEHVLLLSFFLQNQLLPRLEFVNILLSHNRMFHRHHHIVHMLMVSFHNIGYTGILSKPGLTVMTSPSPTNFPV